MSKLTTGERIANRVDFMCLDICDGEEQRIKLARAIDRAVSRAKAKAKKKARKQ